MSTLAGTDAFDSRLVRRARGLLSEFNRAGVLTAADVHVALRLGQLGDTSDEASLLAAAFAVRAPRLGHVCVDLATIRTTATTDLDEPIDLQQLSWPGAREWIGRLESCPLVGSGRPLKLDGTVLYLDRFWTEERQVASDLLALAERPAELVDPKVLALGLTQLFSSDDDPDFQRLAAGSAILRRFSVIAGGPGTGKTTTVARVLALLVEQAFAAGRRPPLVALAAPTGKAAGRLEEAVHEEAAKLKSTASRDFLAGLDAMTLHRLLGWNPGNHSRFRHNRSNRLAHDVIVVDETSMLSLSLMARLVEAVRLDARLILVGDPEQLASVEAGAVLGDVVGPAVRGLQMRARAREELAAVTGQVVPAFDPPSGTSIGDGLVLLRRGHRFGGGIAKLAEAVQSGDDASALSTLREGGPDVVWIQVDLAAAGASEKLGPVRDAAVANGQRLMRAARARRGADALEALGAFRLLCAHRRGPEGVTTWTSTVESWLAAEIQGFGEGGPWYIGRPLLVTENDYSLRLYNGDTGIVIAADAEIEDTRYPGGVPSPGTGSPLGNRPGRVVAAFERGGKVIEISPTRLASVDTVYAMTVHKAQGSQFGTVAILLPRPDSPILTRELLYTAVTRAQRTLLVAGTEEAIRAAITRPIARASGLRRALWGEEE